MPNPKRRHSSRRTANRRAHDFLTSTGHESDVKQLADAYLHLKATGRL